VTAVAQLFQLDLKRMIESSTVDHGDSTLTRKHAPG
jgi:hypothetical protein